MQSLLILRSSGDARYCGDVFFIGASRRSGEVVRSVPGGPELGRVAARGDRLVLHLRRRNGDDEQLDGDDGGERQIPRANSALHVGPTP